MTLNQTKEGTLVNIVKLTFKVLEVLIQRIIAAHDAEEFTR